MAALIRIPPPKPPLLPSSSSQKMTRGPIAALNRTTNLRVPFQLKQGQSRLFHELPSGLSMEVIFQSGVPTDPYENDEPGTKNPPLVFIHGSFHAAWCWAEHWLPFFSSSGFDCYALSLLGQGESDLPPGFVAGTLETHASDVADFIAKEITSPPVLVGHSFGGLIVQHFISKMTGHYSPTGKKFSKSTLAGAVLVCSVPPSGNNGLAWRYLLSKPIAAFKKMRKATLDLSAWVTLSLAGKAFATSLPLCKETFFSAEMEDHLVQRYQELLKESSRMPLFDLKKLNASLPPPPVTRNSVEILVMGASDDFIVDAEGLAETAEFYGVSPICIDALAHDMMLDFSWEKGAKVILSWVKNLK